MLDQVRLTWVGLGLDRRLWSTSECEYRFLQRAIKEINLISQLYKWILLLTSQQVNKLLKIKVNKGNKIILRYSKKKSKANVFSLWSYYQPNNLTKINHNPAKHCLSYEHMSHLASTWRSGLCYFLYLDTYFFMQINNHVASLNLKFVIEEVPRLIKCQAQCFLLIKNGLRNISLVCVWNR